MRWKRTARALIILVALLITLISAAWPERRMHALRLLAFISGSQSLSEFEPESELAAESVDWFDNYFTLEHIDLQTIAIGEPRYWQQNYSYLILGTERAVLFDSGSGQRNIKAVVDSLTYLPVTVVASHLHYDHLGSINSFDRIAMLDLPDLRDQARDGVFKPLENQHLGFIEGVAAPELVVAEWWKPGKQIDLGERILEVIHAPGHTPESIVLLDRGRQLLFTGDFIYEGFLAAVMPGSDMNDYFKSAQKLISAVSPESKLLTGHRATAPAAPVLGYRDLADLADTLGQVLDGSLDGEGFVVKAYPVNSNMTLIAESP